MHPFKFYPSLIHKLHKFGGEAHTRREAMELVQQKILTFTHPSVATELLSHISNYLGCTIND
jgi:hypothetical protein